MYRAETQRLKPPARRHLLSAITGMLLSAILLLSACTPQQPQQHDYTLFTFGTLVEISLYDVPPELAEQAFEMLQADFADFHQNWSPWTDGALAELNRRLATQLNTPLQVSPTLLPLIRRSMQLSELSNGLYNPTIGRLINLWQFHRASDPGMHPPTAEKIHALVAKDPHMSDLRLDSQNHLINSNAAVSLNFGAFAKGYAIALEITRLKKLGIHNAVINAGGDLSVIGRHGDRAWNIGIRHPRKQGLLASVEISGDESVFTSGDYERFYIHQGRRYHHILDPRSGYPARGAQSVTVIHADAGLADAAATALLVAGADHWQTLARKLGLRYVMLVDAKGQIHISRQMRQRIRFLEKTATLHIIEADDL